ncbi:hypothetical protein K502DRAFT_366259 [Neoconidiobolus thromboides FSU 785]|nr:hypothetical protein K502DRAFT_366259 [Neoconidiobolus thromboides FSU 785]
MDISKQFNKITIESLNRNFTFIDAFNTVTSSQHRHLGIQDIDSTLFNEKGVVVGDIIELIGKSGSGKSILLKEIIIRTIIPTKLYWQQDILLNGYDSKAFYFDGDLCFDILFFYDKICQYLVRYLENKGYKINTQNENLNQEPWIPLKLIQDTAKNSLKNLFIYSPTSFYDLTDTLAHFSSAYNFSNQQNQELPATNIIVIDSITQYYWGTKFGVREIAKNQYYLAQLEFVAILKACLKDLNAFSIITSWAYLYNKTMTENSSNLGLLRDESNLSDNEINSSVLNDALNYRLLLNPRLANDTNADVTPRESINEDEIDIKVVHPDKFNGTSVQYKLW